MRQRNEHLETGLPQALMWLLDWKQEPSEARSRGVNVLGHGMEEGALTSTSQGAEGNASNTP